jgi:hypothetical protein
MVCLSRILSGGVIFIVLVKRFYDVMKALPKVVEMPDQMSDDRYRKTIVPSAHDDRGREFRETVGRENNASCLAPIWFATIGFNWP